MSDLPYQLNRTVTIKAKPETVFRFFTDSARWAGWWGAGSTIDARPGGKVYIRYPNGVENSGEVLELRKPELIVFTYGYTGGKPIPPGSSRVTIRLEPDKDGTRLHLIHEFAEAGPRDQHVQGWLFQLSVFSNLVADEVFAGAARVVDAWFDAWANTDGKAREEAFAGIATKEIQFRDRHSLLTGVADLTAHSGAAQRHSPGITLRRKGGIRHCQGTVLAEWVAVDGEGKQRVSGTSVFALDTDGRIDSVTGFANPAL